jgi:hypothetical protein
MKNRTDQPTAKPALTKRPPGPFRPQAAAPPAKPSPPALVESPPAPAKPNGNGNWNGNGSGQTPERVSASGLVHIADEAKISAVPLHYYAEKSRWYAPNKRGGFGNLSDSQAKSLVAEYGFHKSVKDDQGNAPAERAQLWLIQSRAVAYAGLLAGYRAGSHEVDGGRILVTDSPRLVEPKPGQCATIRRLIETMLADAAHPQADYFYLWASESFAAYWQRMGTPAPWPFRFCPALALFGPRQCGKSSLIELVLAPLFGGRKADPMNFLREPTFNKDLFAASLLVLDDKGASASLTERRQRGEGIKDLIWKPEQRMEGKGADAVMLRPFWRLVIAGNDDDTALQVCPALSDSLKDKLLILRAQPAEGLPTTHEENDAWAAAIRAELPAFAAFLLGWRPPAGLALDQRTRVANFWHPELAALLRDMQPEMRLLELIDGSGLIDADGGLWEGTASQFERALRSKGGESSLDRLFTTSTSSGRMLSELARMSPDRVKKTDRDGVSHYRIFSRK